MMYFLPSFVLEGFTGAARERDNFAANLLIADMTLGLACLAQIIAQAIETCGGTRTIPFGHLAIAIFFRRIAETRRFRIEQIFRNIKEEVGLHLRFGAVTAVK